ncbi:hypothetical protein A5637_13225 [Mycolicibacterium fortuitum]|uniref:hypothetical protein n=1 Tax=Mycolicibacterium fortuitum TaxID=1766 RepID=UPI0007EE0ED0|nr:hypothetical protein [Mycolicibacterium fortuitum]OBK04037.1 hypothetical protein A5637_13225 [Mycolicibacterium fortuitum]
MNQCQACTGRAQLYLCPQCTNQLRALIAAFVAGPETNGRPTSGLIEDLTDVALRRTKLGSTGDHSHRKRGDEQPALYEPDTENNRRTRQGDAAFVLGQINTTLTAIIEAIHTGTITPRGTSTDMAIYLTHHVPAIANHEQAGHWHNTIAGLTKRITHITDRPARRVWLGPCPTWDDTTRHACGTDLYAPEDAIEVHCRTCRATHNCNRLKLLQQNDIERQLLTWEQVLNANKWQPDEYRVQERTLRHWRKTGKLTPKGWLRPNGRHGGTQHTTNDQPLYRWSDVRRLRSEKPQASKTGAAAHKR